MLMKLDFGNATLAGVVENSSYRKIIPTRSITG